MSPDNRKIAAARASIAASILLAVAKLVAGIWSGSLALLSEAGHAFVDTAATMLTYYAVREAEKPADEEHHYGHGKFEALAALVETGCLFGLALFVVAEALRRLREPEIVLDPGVFVYGVLGLSIVIDFFRSTQLRAIAEEEHSEALAADAVHFSSDLVSSLLVLIGMLATHFGFMKGDGLAALGVAVFIAIAGYRLGRRTINTLLDTAPGDLTPRLEQALAKVPGVISIDQIRLRSVGHEVIGEVIISVARSLRMEQAAHIKHAAMMAILEAEPRAKMTVVIEPRALDDETVIERTMLVAAHSHLSAHNIIAQQIDGRLSIGVDIELDGTMPIGRAHAIATEFERSIRDEFGSDVEIETHIEPFSPHILTGIDADLMTRETVLSSLVRLSEKNEWITNIHDVRVRETIGGWIINYHGRVSPSVPVDIVHNAVDDIERRMRDIFPQILRIVGHVEPVDHS